MEKAKRFILCGVLCALTSAGMATWNDPYPKEDKGKNILYDSFSERPKTLDPAKSYSSNEYQIIAQIYEPPLQYHYLKRPYELIPLTADKMPNVAYFNKKNEKVSADSPDVAYTLYTVTIKPAIFYQPHPALAKNEKGNYVYHHLDEDYLDENDVSTLSDFKKVGTRELAADDYVYQIKRLAHPQIHSPIFGLMSEYIVGLQAFAEKLTAMQQKGEPINLRTMPLDGVKVLSRYQYQIKIKGKYPQFLYWLAMPFFAPVPWEADTFYAQEGMDDNNLSLSWFPIGTGAYYLTENDPNKQMVLEKNPHYHMENYPSEGSKKDKGKGLLLDAGKALPFIDKVIFTLEKESIPRWSKFLQGYYDKSGVSSDSFDQAIKVTANGKAILTPEMKDKGIRLQSAVEPSVYYFGFNMLDKTVGGYSRRARLLRRAISIALDYEEYISIFLNGRGRAAQGPIPPGIDGFGEKSDWINPYVYNKKNKKAQRKSIEEAKRLLKKADYPNGIDKKTARPLILNYDVASGNGPDEKAQFNWYRKQFAKLGIKLNIRATQYNRFQDKMRHGNAQLFSWGWNADYPDPENFLFLLYGANGKVKHGGENAANYHNKAFDQLFDKMKTLPKGEKRTALIKKMVAIVRRDSPWVWGFYPKTFILSQSWMRVTKANTIANNTIKYAKLDAVKRQKLQEKWNKPMVYPIIFFMLFIIVMLLPVYVSYRRKEHSPVKRLPYD